MIVEKIHTSYNAEELFSFFEKDNFSFFLDSSFHTNTLSQFSFMGSNPFLIFSAKDGVCTIIENEKEIKVEKDPFCMLSFLLKKHEIKNSTDFPFIGGAVGYFSYDCKNYIENILDIAKDDINIEDMSWGFYDGILIMDHKTNEVFVCGSSKKIIKDIKEKIIYCTPIKTTISNIKSIFVTPSISHKEYLQKIQKVKDYILNGDIYEVNLTQRFCASLQEDPYVLYKNLRKISPAPFSCYLSFGDVKILSSSPERLLRVRNDFIETRPIKGTRPRGKTKKEDEQYKKELLESEKDQSELLMIVDLSRNDLSKICEPHSVKVSRLFGLEQYATVYHLVSTIEGKRKKNISIIDSIKSLFPGGSITGAPKIRSMEIIEELEPTKRGIYTGSIGYIGFDERVDLNIAIRTMIIKNGKIYFQVGGAITYDSDPQKEYEETLHKAQGMLKALGGILDESSTR